jgi:hypothetical protein
MIACPSCGDSAGVHIEQDSGVPSAGLRTATPAWAARCEGCDTSWSFSD